MSGNPFPFFIIKRNDKPKEIEARIGLLIRLYLVQPQVEIAKAINNHLNVILATPNYITDVKIRCQYRQLAEHWRLIAWLGKNTANPLSNSQPRLKIALEQLTA